MYSNEYNNDNFFLSGKLRVKGWSDNKEQRSKDKKIKITKEKMLVPQENKKPLAADPEVSNKEEKDEWDDLLISDDNSSIVVSAPEVSDDSDGTPQVTIAFPGWSANSELPYAVLRSNATNDDGIDFTSYHLKPGSNGEKMFLQITLLRPDITPEIAEALTFLIGSESGYKHDVFPTDADGKVKSSAYGYGQLLKSNLDKAVEWIKLFDPSVTTYLNLTPDLQLQAVIHHYYDPNKDKLNGLDRDLAIDFLSTYALMPAAITQGGFTADGVTYRNDPESKHKWLIRNHPNVGKTLKTWRQHLKRRYETAVNS